MDFGILEEGSGNIPGDTETEVIKYKGEMPVWGVDFREESGKNIDSSTVTYVLRQCTVLITKGNGGKEWGLSREWVRMHMGHLYFPSVSVTLNCSVKPIDSTL